MNMKDSKFSDFPNSCFPRCINCLV